MPAALSKPAKPTLKKGFFDSKPVKSKPKDSTPASSDIPMLVGKKQAMGSGASKVPDFMRVEPDEQEKKYEQVRSCARQRSTPAW